MEALHLMMEAQLILQAAVVADSVRGHGPAAEAVQPLMGTLTIRAEQALTVRPLTASEAGVPQELVVLAITALEQQLASMSTITVVPEEMDRRRVTDQASLQPILTAAAVAAEQETLPVERAILVM